MKCSSCGKQIIDEAVFCPQCGVRLLSVDAQPPNSNQSGDVNMNASRDTIVEQDVVGRDKIEIHVSQGTNFLHQIWDNLDPELQDALSLAYNQSHRNGSNLIKTRTFFASLMRLRPGPLEEFIQQLPPDAFPKPISADITTEKLILQEDPQLSACIEDSLRNLTPKTTSERRLSSADMFVDLANHGTGNSVARLRTYGVTPDKVNAIVEQLGWNVIQR